MPPQADPAQPAVEGPQQRRPAPNPAPQKVQLRPPSASLRRLMAEVEAKKAEPNRL
jgi:hypothetical protein